MKRPHADLIHAYADGAHIQYRVSPDNPWADIENPAFRETTEYRIKPGPKKYRVALMDYGALIAECDKDAISIELFTTFIKWLNDWQYYEEESC